MKVTATAKFVRLSPRKARLVVDHVRGMSVPEAESALSVMAKKGAEPVMKLLKSAVANAEHNYKLDKKNLVITEIAANEGMTIKRFRPRAFGRATMIRKRTSHLSIVLDEQKSSEEKPAKKEEEKKTEKAAPKKKTAEKKAVKPKKTTDKKES
jgi:large subunit ribosomal protein L22